MNQQMTDKADDYARKCGHCKMCKHTGSQK